MTTDSNHNGSYRILVMGVSGSGKSHIGQQLAASMEATFIDGDDHHSPANVAKMASGTPLNDDDRLDAGRLCDRSIDHLFEAEGSAFSVPSVCSDDELRIGVVDAIAESVRCV